MTQQASVPMSDAPADFSFVDGLRNEIRREQLALEAAPLVMELIHSTPTLDLYGDVLSRWYRVISAIQPGTDRALGAVGPETGWLEGDLSLLGRIPCARWTDAPDFSKAESLGYRLAIESQHLRSRVILPTLKHALGDQTGAFSFFEAHGGDTRTWRSLVRTLDALDVGERRDVLVGARATLVALERALSG